jgi:uncharacterized membrane protein
MTTFTVWRFEDPEGAAQAAKELKAAEREGLVTVVDHAVMTWPEGADKPTTEHHDDDTKRGAAWGAFWGVLTGALFLVPVAGGVAGVAIGALAKSTQGTGITKEDLTRIRTEIVPGTSALFVVTEGGNLDRLGDHVRMSNHTLIHTNLTDAERSTLLETFGGSSSSSSR